MAAERLREVLERSQELGFLGPGPVVDHIEHARTLAALIGAPEGRFLDLGAGGGVPGLVLAEQWPASEGVLLDAGARRCEFLEGALEDLDLGARLVVRCGRAEELARDPRLRGGCSLVVARGFGPPAVTAECGVGFLAAGGRLVVTEPPDDGSPVDRRWPEAPLSELGLSPPQPAREGAVGIVTMARRGELAERWPRRVGVPSKRPLW